MLRLSMIFLSLCLLLTSIAPSLAYGETQNEEQGKIVNTENWIIENQMNQMAEEEESDPEQIPVFSAKDIKKMDWDTISKEDAVKIYNSFDRETLKIAAYFYSSLQIFLSKKEEDEIFEWNDDEAFKNFEKLSSEQQQLLSQYTRGITDLKKFREQEKDTDTGKRKVMNTDGTRYTAKQMQYPIINNFDFNPVDDFSRSSNISQTDLVLSGLNGMDLVIQRSYNSMNSATQEPSFNMDEDENDLEDKKFSNEFIPFAKGWSFNLPTFEYMETIGNPGSGTADCPASEEDEDDAYLEDYEGGCFQYDSQPLDNISRYIIQLDNGKTLVVEGGKIINYPYDGVAFQEETAGEEFQIIYGGYRYHFEKYGDNLLKVSKTNPFNNTITYEFNTNENNVVVITDTLKRRIVMEKDPIDDGITSIKVYKNSTSDPIKTVHYSLSEPDDGIYLQLDKVKKGGKITEKYEYITEEAEFNLKSIYILYQEPQGSFVDDWPYIKKDNVKRKKLNYRLIENAYFPVSGSSIHFEYHEFDKKSDHPESRNVIRNYLDANLLAYISYPAVKGVLYAYTPYNGTQQHRKIYYPLSNLENNKQEVWEIWPVSRKGITREQKDIRNRMGDLFTWSQYHHWLEKDRVKGTNVINKQTDKTFFVDGLGNHFQKRICSTVYNSPNLVDTNETKVNESFEYNPTSCTSYAYKPLTNDSNSKLELQPSFVFSFLDSDNVNQSVRNFLKDPQIDFEGQPIGLILPSLGTYSLVTEYKYNDYGDVIKRVTPDKIITKWGYKEFDIMWEDVSEEESKVSGAYRPVQSETITDKNDEDEKCIPIHKSFEYDNTTMLLEKETSTYCYRELSETNNTETFRNETEKKQYAYKKSELADGESHFLLSEFTVTLNSGEGNELKYTTKFDYDTFGHKNQITMVDVELGENKSESISLEYEYEDGLDDLKSQTFADGSKVQYTYDDLDRIEKELFTSKDGNSTMAYEYAYNDADDNLDGVVDDDDDKEHRKVTKKKTIKQTTKEITSADGDDGYKEITYYTPYGDVEYQGQESTAGIRTLVVNEYDFSLDGRHLMSTTPYGDSNYKTEFTYYGDGSLRTSTNPLTETTAYNYANALKIKSGSNISGYLPQNAVFVSEPGGPKIREFMNRNGQVELRTEETIDRKQKRTVLYDYDAFGRKKKETINNKEGKSRIEEYRYDLKNNLVFLKQQLDQDKKQEYAYKYDLAGNLLSIKENGKLTRTMEYNALSWKLSDTDKYPEPTDKLAEQTEKYSYTPSGLLESYTDKVGNSYHYTYTPFDELENTTVKHGNDVLYEETNQYNKLTGLLEKQWNKSSGNYSYQHEIEYLYDSYRRHDGIKVFGREYRVQCDNTGYSCTRKDPDGKTVEYTKDKLGRLSEVKGTILPGTVSYNYQKLTDSNGNYLGFEQSTLTYPNGLSVEKKFNSFGELENTKQKKGAQETVEQLKYDGFGNLETMTKGGQVSTFFYDKLDRVTEEIHPTDRKVYTYDDRGNRETISRTPLVLEEAEYQYDGLNRLVHYSTGGKEGTYTYYPGGLLATKKDGSGNVTKFVYWEGKVIEELNDSNESTAKTVWGNEILYREDKGSNKGYYLTNSHGDVESIVDTTGTTTLNMYRYDIWGNILEKTEMMDNPFTYTGEMYEEDTKLYYLRARFYDPSVGRFITEDTYKGQVDNPLSLNRYTYTHNNPLRFIDPSGHKAWLIHGTWSDPTTWTPEFREYIKSVFNEEIGLVQWSGDNSKEARAEAAAKLAKEIYDWHKANPNEPIRLVAHSHGGNVSILAANILSKLGVSIDTLVTIATPVREEYQLEAKVGQHINVYNEYDDVQITGGSPNNLGMSGRDFSNAENVKVELPWWRENTWFGASNHSYMHSSVKVWKEYITSLLNITSKK